MAAQERPKGRCPECDRVISGRAAGPAMVLLRSHNREPNGSKKHTVCLSQGGYRKVPRIRE